MRESVRKGTGFFTMPFLAGYVLPARRALGRLFLLALLATLFPSQALAWYDTAWAFRVPINIPTAGVNSTIKVDVDFAALLSALGIAGTFDANSPRIVRSDDLTLSTNQEFTDTVYAGATDAAGNARGEIRFLLEDAAPAQYYLYFDITANGTKPANPQMPINGNFEQGFAPGASATLNNPKGWNAVSASSTIYDGQVRPSEPALSITDTGGSGSTASTDGTPFTGAYSFLLGNRTNADLNGGNPGVTLSRTIAVPATSPGNLVFRYRPEGWDSSDNNVARWDFLDVRIMGATTSTLVGPALRNYTTFPFSPNKGLGQISNTRSGYGRYNYWDNNAQSTNTAGMSLNPGDQPWFTKTFDLTPYANQTVTLRFQMTFSSQYKSWMHLDDVEWSVVAATLGSAQALAAFTLGNFNAFETSTTPASATVGVLMTKIAGQAFGFDVVALNAVGSRFSSFGGSVKIEIVDGSGSTACASRPLFATVTSSYTFTASDNGRHTFTGVVVPGAYRDALVRITSVGTTAVTACSTDHFAIRPNNIALSATHNDWMTAGTAAALNNMAASGGVVHKAGRPFTLTATAYDGSAAPAVASLYQGTASFVFSTCAGTACIGSPATMEIGGAAATGLSFSGGSITTNTAAYMDAGAVTMQLQDTSFAVIDSADTPATCAGYYVCSNAIVLGRFVPDSFVVSANVPQFKTFNTADGSCNAGAGSPKRSFTYLGQAFGYVSSAVPIFTVRAVNAKGATTLNYAGALWHLPSPASVATSCSSSVCTFAAPSGAAVPTVQTSYSYTSTGSLPGWSASQVVADVPIITPGSASPPGGTGTVTYSAGDMLAFARSPTTPVAPWSATISLTPQINDTSETAGTIATAMPPTVSIGFDSGSEFRYGRLKLSNAYGSELLNLPIPMETQYWTGSAFATNANDNCTAISSAGNVNLGNYQGGINSSNMASPGNILLGGAFLAGKESLQLSKPLPAPSSKGSVDVTVTLTAEGKNYLQGKWTGSTYTVNPTARAAFGLRKGGPIIFMREMY